MKAANLIIGPPAAGKTAMLAALHHASLRHRRRGGVHAIYIHPENTPMERLLHTTEREFPDTGQLQPPADTHMETYHFSVELRRTRWLGLRNATPKRHLFQVIDGAGGSLFGQEDQADPVANELRRSMLAALSEAPGIILCLDATDVDATRLVKKYLGGILRDCKESVLPCKRFCICLTKVDKLLQAHEDYAETETLETCPQRFADYCMYLKDAFSSIAQRLHPSARLAIGWTSIYGFQSDGSANFDPVQQQPGQLES